MTTLKKRIGKIMSEFGVKFDESKYEDVEAESDLVRKIHMHERTGTGNWTQEMEAE